MEKQSLSGKVKALIKQQKESWQLAKDNYAGLYHIESKTFQFSGFQLTAQFNPKRIHSSAAKTDAQSIRQRACFLCAANRPNEQIGIPFNKKYTILVNPFPIFNEHLTIPFNKHDPQEIEPYFTDMLELSKELPEFTIFYNGAQCGASAPDHFHFQAGNKNVMPVFSEINSIAERYGEILFSNNRSTITAIGQQYLRKLILLKSNSEKELCTHFKHILRILKERQQENEPMLNLLTNYENGSWQIILFPRDKQRPSQFFAQGETQILISPAAVELGGLAILPRKEDFNKLTEYDLKDIYNQVTMNDQDFEQMKREIKKNL